MLRKSRGMFILAIALTTLLPAVSGMGIVARADTLPAQTGRIFPAWFFRSHSSNDTKLWGNRGVAPGGYFVGGPAKQTAVKTVTTVAPAKPVPAKRTAVVPKPKVVVTTHTVVKGECLWYIAGYKNIYGDPTKWPLIYQANKDKVKNPNLIYPGQVLRIPR